MINEIKEKIDFYALFSTPGIGKKAMFHLMERYDNPSTVWNMDEESVKKLFKPKQAEKFLSFRKNFDPLKSYEHMEQQGIQMITYLDKEFPNKLKNIPDMPCAIFVKGSLPDPNAPSVAIIGARMCSEYGRFEAREFGLKLARAGIQIISGMALGIDGISQKAALNAGGKTFAVLGSGVDICYPSENIEIYNKITEKDSNVGGLISEYPPGTPPSSKLFPPRNRIISALSDIVLVIEARKKSGTLITVDMALEQGREVFAVPGRITDRLSDGCNYLIKQGSGIALSPEDIINEFSYCTNTAKASCNSLQNSSKEISLPKIPLNEHEKKIFSVLDINPKNSADIIADLNRKGDAISPEIVMQNLTMMELKGIIKSSGSNYFITLD